MASPRKYDAAKGSLGGYLCGIARNVLRGQAGIGGRELPLDEELPEEGMAAEGDLLAELAHQEKLECLRRSVLALPHPYREALVLCDMEERSYPEAAAILECPAGTVASRLHRARAMLRSRLKELGCVR